MEDGDRVEKVGDLFDPDDPRPLKGSIVTWSQVTRVPVCEKNPSLERA